MCQALTRMRQDQQGKRKRDSHRSRGLITPGRQSGLIEHAQAEASQTIDELTERAEALHTSSSNIRPLVSKSGGLLETAQDSDKEHLVAHEPQGDRFQMPQLSPLHKSCHLVSAHAPPSHARAAIQAIFDVEALQKLTTAQPHKVSCIH